MPRIALSAFYFLLSALAWLTPTLAHAESTLYIKADDDEVRATERLYDFLDDLGYTLEYRDGDKDSLIIHQQGQKAHVTLKTGDKLELCTITIAVHYGFNRKAATANERALVANAINNAQFNMKVCVNEDIGGFYFEYTLPFDHYLHPRVIKNFADQAIARSYLMINHHKELKQTFYGDEDESPDSAKNADETDEGSDDDPAMTDTDDAQAGKADAADAKPGEPSAPATQPPSSPANTANPASPANTANPDPHSLVPELPPTTPASPARTKKAHA